MKPDRMSGSVHSLYGLPITSTRRAIEDCHRAHLGPALVRQALEEAERGGS